MKNRIHGKGIAFIFCLIGISALLVIVFGLIEQSVDKAESSIWGEDAFSQAEGTVEQIYHNGALYTRDDAVESLLILGIDKKEDSSEEHQHSEQADFLLLVVLNKDEKTYTFLHLNRDTMTAISQTDAYGKAYGEFTGQLALAYAYGKNEKMRCRNTVKAVENLLYGIEIDHYLSLPMDAVSILNDSVGGVTLQLTEEYTEIDETFVKDAVVTLKGEQALAFVQGKDALEDSSNLSERQKQYITALFRKIGSSKFENTVDTMMKISKHLVSDCTINQLSGVIVKLGSYTYEGTVSLEGEAVKGKQYMEYYVDDEAAKAVVVELFYEKCE